jgi:hypothetical protein
MRFFRTSRLVVPFVSTALFLIAASLPVHGQHVQAAAVGQVDAPEIKEFQTIEDQWSTALIKADQYTLELLMSPLYVDISSGGEVTTRNQQIALLFEKTTSLLSVEQKVASVREFGDTAVVSGTYIIKRKVNGEAREERGIFTHVFARSRGKWSCVNSQRTTVVEQAVNKPKAPEKKSNAEQPFHIPFFHKGAESTQPPVDPGSNPAAPN